MKNPNIIIVGAIGHGISCAMGNTKNTLAVVDFEKKQKAEQKPLEVHKYSIINHRLEEPWMDRVELHKIPKNAFTNFVNNKKKSFKSKKR